MEEVYVAMLTDHLIWMDYRWLRRCTGIWVGTKFCPQPRSNDWVYAAFFLQPDYQFVIWELWRVHRCLLNTPNVSFSVYAGREISRFLLCSSNWRKLQRRGASDKSTWCSTDFGVLANGDNQMTCCIMIDGAGNACTINTEYETP